MSHAGGLTDGQLSFGVGTVHEKTVIHDLPPTQNVGVLPFSFCKLSFCMFSPQTQLLLGLAEISGYVWDIWAYIILPFLCLCNTIRMGFGIFASFSHVLHS